MDFKDELNLIMERLERSHQKAMEAIDAYNKEIKGLEKVIDEMLGKEMNG